MDHVSFVATSEKSTQKREGRSKIAYTVHEAVHASGLSRSSVFMLQLVTALCVRTSTALVH